MANTHFDLTMGNNYSLTVPTISANLSIFQANTPRNITFCEANVIIWANGHVVYDETKTDESAKKFWDAVRRYIIGET